VYFPNTCDQLVLVGNIGDTSQMYVPTNSVAVGNFTWNASGGALYMAGNYGVAVGNQDGYSTYGIQTNADYMVITGNNYIVSDGDAVHLNSGSSTGVISGNLMFYAGNTYNDIDMVGTNDHFAVTGNTFFSAADKSERCLGAVNSDDCTFVGNTSDGHDTEGINLDVNSSGWVVLGNRFTEGTRITNAGSNNIIFDHDNTNMRTWINHEPVATKLGLYDTGDDHVLSIVAGTDLTADRILTLTTGDAARTITLNADVTLDATITALTGVLTAANKIPYATAADTASELDLATTVGDPGSDTTLVSEQGIREGLDAVGGGEVKGWIKFDMQGAGGIDGSENVASITDDAVGQWTITWDTDFADAHYSCVCTPGLTSSNEWVIGFFASQAAGSVQLRTTYEGVGYSDINDNFVIAAGGQ